MSKQTFEKNTEGYISTLLSYAWETVFTAVYIWQETLILIKWMEEEITRTYFVCRLKSIFYFRPCKVVNYVQALYECYNPGLYSGEEA